MKKKNSVFKRFLASTVTMAIVLVNMNGIFTYATQDTTYQCGDLEITYTVTGEWDNHQNVQLYISNPTDSPICRWAFQYDAGGTITDIWNASVVESKDTVYVIENKDYNNYISPHSTQLIGYVLEYDETEPEVTDFTNCIERISSDSTFEAASYIQANSPESGNGVISINNTSENPLYGWELSFKSDTPIANCYDAKLIEESDNNYIISCEGWNSVIFPGDTLNLGVVADFTDFTDFQISDAVLTSDVLSYTFDEQSDSPLQLKAFSDYGINILNWTYDNDVPFDIYRKSDDEFTCVGNTNAFNVLS